MSLVHLLGAKAHHLDRLALWRVQLDRQSPAITLTGERVEGVLYALTGRALVYTEGQYLGSCGGRWHMREEIAQAWRFRGCGEITLTLSHEVFAGDFLWMTCACAVGIDLPMIDKHVEDAAWHAVGEGTHLRRVADIPTPRGALIACGETHSPAGGWSSYPPHATAEDIERFSNGETTWEEMFFCVCQKPGIAVLNGVYTGGVIVNTIQTMENGNAYVVPLGSHPVVAHPESSFSYVWVYTGTALQKSYNKSATDLSTYIK